MIGNGAAHRWRRIAARQDLPGRIELAARAREFAAVDRNARIHKQAHRYLSQLDTDDRQGPSEAVVTKTTRLKEKLARLAEEMRRLDLIEAQMLAAPISRSPSPIPIPAQWRRADAAQVLSATTCRSRSTPSII